MLQVSRDAGYAELSMRMRIGMGAWGRMRATERTTQVIGTDDGATERGLRVIGTDDGATERGRRVIGTDNAITERG